VLVLNRKPGQAVVIDGRILLVVQKSSAGSVKLAFEAPEDVTIHREEVYQEIQDELRRQQ